MPFAASSRKPRGAVAVIVAISLVGLGAMLALVLNTGHAMAVRGELQNAADAAAIAGAMDLDGTLERLDDAHAAGLGYLGSHSTDVSVPIGQRAEDVQLGHWDPIARTFTPLTATDAAAARQVNAVRAVAYRTAARSSALTAFLGAFLRRETVDVAAEAIAVTGGPSIQAPSVPLAFFDCGIMQDYDLRCGERLRMHGTTASDPTDTIGFTSLSEASANTALYNDILAGGTRVQVSTGQCINIQNGSNLQPTSAGFSALIGQKVTAPIVEGECPPRFTQCHTVIGFATFTILAVSTGADKYIDVQFMCNEQLPVAEPGGGFFGTGPLQPRLTL